MSDGPRSTPAAGSPPRPTNLVVVAGTATDVGKTWVGARLCEALRVAGWRVAVRKPVQSFDPADSAPHDREVLAASTGEPPAIVCADDRCYELAMAPPMAAAQLARSVPSAADILGELAAGWPTERFDIGVVESVGGVGSPIAQDLDTASLVAALAPEVVVLVADAGLGTVGAVRANLSLLTAQGTSPVPVVVHLNRFSAESVIDEANRDWLVTTDGCDVTTSIDDLAQQVGRRLARFDRHSGRRLEANDVEDATTFDPGRYCPHCGRRLKVTVVPTGHRGRCRWHGEVDVAHHGTGSAD